MNNFKIIKKGYSQLEVDSYIDRLKEDYESRLSEQKDRIFYLKDQLDKVTSSPDKELVTSLVSAIERAKIIENSSKNIYELETKKLKLLYTKMENVLNDGNIQDLSEIKKNLLSLIQDCRNSLQTNIYRENQNIKESEVVDPIKKLLSKMLVDRKSQSEASSKIEQTSVAVERNFSNNILEGDTELQGTKYSVQTQTIQAKKQEKPKQTPIVQNAFAKFLSDNVGINGANFESIMFSKNVDEISNRNSIQESKIISIESSSPSVSINVSKVGSYAPNESGFDLKEAINPKEDLDEIMKAFDFFNDKKN